MCLLGYVSVNNKTFKLKDVLKLCEESIGRTELVETWKNSVDHVKRLEKLIMEQENIAEEIMEPIRCRSLIIRIGNDGSSSSEDEDQNNY